MSQTTLFDYEDDYYSDDDDLCKELRSSYESSVSSSALRESDGFGSKPLPDRPVLHMLRLGDTVKKICQKYDLNPVLFSIVNLIEEITEEVLLKTKFVIIPSLSTFCYRAEYAFEYNCMEEDKIELVRNFCLIFEDLSYEAGEIYLARNNYNLPVAVENYQFDVC